jgi:hypothetical protein
VCAVLALVSQLVAVDEPSALAARPHFGFNKLGPTATAT